MSTMAMLNSPAVIAQVLALLVAALILSVTLASCFQDTLPPALFTWLVESHTAAGRARRARLLTPEIGTPVISDDNSATPLVEAVLNGAVVEQAPALVRSDTVSSEGTVIPTPSITEDDGEVFDKACESPQAIDLGDDQPSPLRRAACLINPAALTRKLNNVNRKPSRRTRKRSSSPVLEDSDSTRLSTEVDNAAAAAEPPSQPVVDNALPLSVEISIAPVEGLRKPSVFRAWSRRANLSSSGQLTEQTPISSTPPSRTASFRRISQRASQAIARRSRSPSPPSPSSDEQSRIDLQPTPGISSRRHSQIQLEIPRRASCDVQPSTTHASGLPLRRSLSGSRANRQAPFDRLIISRLWRSQAERQLQQQQEEQMAAEATLAALAAVSAAAESALNRMGTVSTTHELGIRV